MFYLNIGPTCPRKCSENFYIVLYPKSKTAGYKNFQNTFSNQGVNFKIEHAKINVSRLVIVDIFEGCTLDRVQHNNSQNFSVTKRVYIYLDRVETYFYRKDWPIDLKFCTE